jgi:peptidoglycan/xylan/chitin deacetylase (PgdA/CDA1 family)
VLRSQCASSFVVLSFACLTSVLQNVCGTGVAYCGAPGCQLSFGPACDGNQMPTGKDTSAIPRPQFGNVPYGVSISHCSKNGYVALTFDDGPYIYTAGLLDLLKKNNVSATFFIVGANGGKGQIEDAGTGYPAIIKRMILEGHQVASHTWSHQDLATTTDVQRRNQVVWNEMAFVDILGFFPTYLRPPYTDFNAQTLSYLQTMGYHVVRASVLAELPRLTRMACS